MKKNKLIYLYLFLLSMLIVFVISANKIHSLNMQILSCEQLVDSLQSQIDINYEKEKKLNSTIKKLQNDIECKDSEIINYKQELAGYQSTYKKTFLIYEDEMFEYSNTDKIEKQKEKKLIEFTISFLRHYYFAEYSIDIMLSKFFTESFKSNVEHFDHYFDYFYGDQYDHIGIIAIKKNGRSTYSIQTFVINENVPDGCGGGYSILFTVEEKDETFYINYMEELF